MVDECDADFAAVVGVDDADRIDGRDALFGGQTRTGVDECHAVSRGQGDGNAGAGKDSTANAGASGSVKVKVGKQFTGYYVDALKAGATAEQLEKYTAEK